MSYPRIALPATGGGALFVVGLLYSKFLLVISAVLLGLSLIGLFRSMEGQDFLRRAGLLPVAKPEPGPERWSTPVDPGSYQIMR